MALTYSTGATKKVARAMHKQKKGTSQSGRSGKTVKSRKQAIAIGLSEARKEGKKCPPKNPQRNLCIKQNLNGLKPDRSLSAWVKYGGATSSSSRDTNRRAQMDSIACSGASGTAFARHGTYKANYPLAKMIQMTSLNGALRPAAQTGGFRHATNFCALRI